MCCLVIFILFILCRQVINAGQAKPSPPVGPALGQAGLNIMAFCKEFNAKTQGVKARSARTDEESEEMFSAAAF